MTIIVNLSLFFIFANCVALCDYVQFQFTRKFTKMLIFVLIIKGVHSKSLVSSSWWVLNHLHVYVNLVIVSSDLEKKDNLIEIMSNSER